MDITGFVQAVERQKLRCEGVVVVQRGETIAEHRWTPEAPRNCFSVSKSFAAIAAGMAVDRGKLSPHSRLIEFFPDAAADGKANGKAAGKGRQQRERLAALTLEHLLTMTRGHAQFSRPATAAEALDQELKYEPGSRFVYDNGSTLLASAMFTRAMGTTMRDYLLDALFRPLGIGDPEWPQSPDGYTVAGTGLMVTTSNLARFGQFLLQRGEWRGERLVSPQWIDCAGRPHVSTRDIRRPDGDLGYGYGFWPCRHGAYRADGKDGQFVVVLPRQDAVVAISSDEPEPYPILYAVWDEILPLLSARLL
jgi:CubicO group peptidase (beta-lactamase class C family)